MLKYPAFMNAKSSFRRSRGAVTPVKTGAPSMTMFWLPAFAGMTAEMYAPG